MMLPRLEKKKIKMTEKRWSPVKKVPPNSHENSTLLFNRTKSKVAGAFILRFPPRQKNQSKF